MKEKGGKRKICFRKFKDISILLPFSASAFFPPPPTLMSLVPYPQPHHSPQLQQIGQRVRNWLQAWPICSLARKVFRIFGILEFWNGMLSNWVYELKGVKLNNHDEKVRSKRTKWKTMRPLTKGKSDFVLDNIPVPRIPGLLFLPLHSLRSLNFPSHFPLFTEEKKKIPQKKDFLKWVLSRFQIIDLEGKGY